MHRWLCKLYLYMIPSAIAEQCMSMVTLLSCSSLTLGCDECCSMPVPTYSCWIYQESLKALHRVSLHPSSSFIITVFIIFPMSWSVSLPWAVMCYHFQKMDIGASPCKLILVHGMHTKASQALISLRKHWLRKNEVISHPATVRCHVPASCFH